MSRVVPVSDDALNEAADILRNGGLVAVPTETVYGLAADATNADAVARIYEAKGRPGANPLICHVANVEMALRFGLLGETAKRLADTFWPGPLTLVVPAGAMQTAPAVRAGLATIALRHPIGAMTQLSALLGKPIAAPSANTSGRLSPTRAQHVAADLGEPRRSHSRWRWLRGGAGKHHRETGRPVGSAAARRARDAVHAGDSGSIGRRRAGQRRPRKPRHPFPPLCTEHAPSTERRKCGRQAKPCWDSAPAAKPRSISAFAAISRKRRTTCSTCCGNWTGRATLASQSRQFLNTVQAVRSTTVCAGRQTPPGNNSGRLTGPLQGVTNR